MRPDTVTETSPLFAARIAGALWLIVIVASIASVTGTRPLDWRADPATLVAAATNAASRIRLGFAVNFFGKACYIGVTVILYELLKPVNKSVALFSAFCGLAGLSTGISTINDFTGLSLLEESRRVAEPLASQLQSTAKTIIMTHSLGSGGEIVMWTSSNEGESWKQVKQLTRESKLNHTYPRRPVDAQPQFYALWADGNPLERSESHLYFTDRDGSHVWRLPAHTNGKFAKPEVVW